MSAVTTEQINADPNVAPILARMRDAKAELDRVRRDRRSSNRRIDAAEQTFAVAAEDYRVAAKRAAERLLSQLETGSSAMVGPSLADVFREWCAIEELEDEELAATIGCGVGDLIGLYEERRPAAETFDRDVRDIATRRGFDAAGLAKVIRRVDEVAAELAASETWLRAAFAPKGAA